MPIIDIQRVLCPVDLSACSRHALAYASTLAQWYGARLTVLHVFELFISPQLLPVDPRAMATSYPSRNEIATDVARFVEPLKDPRVAIDLLVEEGHVARKIVEIATELPADLIVIGTHGRGGVEHLLLGSVTEKVLRKAACPVLIVPPAASSAYPAVRFRHILCPVDFGSSSMKALHYALSLAQEAEATLTVLHVMESLPSEALAIPFDVPEYRRLREEDARARLQAAIPADVREWCHPIEVVAEGKPYREILRVAQETGTDLIVMGVAGRGAVDLMLFGSTTNHVVRRAACPVLTLRTASGSAEAKP